MKTYDITPYEYNEQEDLGKHKAWFLDGTHCVPPWTPMMGWFWVNYCGHGLQWAAEKLGLPTCKGYDWRLKDGGGYVGILIVDDEEEIRQREERFRQNIIPFIQDYEGEWRKCVDEVLELYEGLKQTNLDTCTNIELLEHFEQTINVYRRQWELHFYLMYLVFGVFILFEAICKEWVGIDDTNPDFHKLMRGFDNKIFQIDKRLWQFSKQVVELGLEEIILESDSEEYVTKLNAHPNGPKFLAELQEYLEIEGWRGSGCDITVPIWVENPRAPLAAIKAFLVKGGDFDLDGERAKLAEEREQLENNILAKLPEEQRNYFKTIMGLAQRSSNFSEEHNQYFDLYCHAMVRRACLGVGRRFVQAGTMDKVEDIFFLVPDEVRKACLNPDWHNYRNTVGRRRAEWEEWCTKENPPILGNVTMDEAMGILVKSHDPIVLKVIIGSFPVPKPELKADLYGISGSPGVVEGVARLVFNEKDLDYLQPGEILVAPATYPSWTPVFGMIKGVVVDRGASLSHAAIVGREYGIPVVMNVFDGSKQIKSGMRIRVDGDLGVVYFLDKIIS